MSAMVSANEAAHRFGLSEKTVRRWIRSGRLKADKSGRAYRVMLSEVAALIGPDTVHESGPSADTVRKADIHSAPSTADSMSAMSGIPELVALVDRLQAEARQHAETAAMWQERAGTLADRLAAAESTLLALTAPQSPPEAPGAPQPVEPSTESPDRPLRLWQPWWAIMMAVVVALVLAAVLLARPG